MTKQELIDTLNKVAGNPSILVDNISAGGLDTADMVVMEDGGIMITSSSNWNAATGDSDETMKAAALFYGAE